MKELKGTNVIVADSIANIELLIGVDEAGKLLAEKNLQLALGLTEVKTLLELNLMSRYQSDSMVYKKSSAMMVNSLLANNMKISDL